MIDFRYHIVSLISVFLALAVGIVLGAGPLRDFIADELTGQVEQLREEKEALRADLDSAQRDLEERSAFIAEAAPQLLDGALADRTVAIVELAGANPEVTDAVIARLEQAGAEIVGRVSVSPTWTAADQRPFRSGIAGNLAAYLDPAPAADATTEQQLGAALGQALTLRDPANPAEASEGANAMYELLVSSELIAAVDEPSGPAYTTVVIAPPSPAADADLTEVNATYLELAQALAATGEGSVLAGSNTVPGDLVAAARADAEANAQVTTVDTVGNIVGQVNVPLALAAAIEGSGGHFGFDGETTAVVPDPVTLDVPTPEEFVSAGAQG